MGLGNALFNNELGTGDVAGVSGQAPELTCELTASGDGGIVVQPSVDRLLKQPHLHDAGCTQNRIIIRRKHTGKKKSKNQRVVRYRRTHHGIDVGGID